MPILGYLRGPTEILLWGVTPIIVYLRGLVEILLEGGRGGGQDVHCSGSGTHGNIEISEGHGRDYGRVHQCLDISGVSGTLQRYFWGSQQYWDIVEDSSIRIFLPFGQRSGYSDLCLVGSEFILSVNNLNILSTALLKRPLWDTVWRRGALWRMPIPPVLYL